MKFVKLKLLLTNSKRKNINRVVILQICQKNCAEDLFN